MGITSLGIDTAAINNFQILFSYVSRYQKNAQGGFLPIATAYSLPLQFPPKIKKDDRNASWNVAKMFGREPVVTTSSNDPRKISLETSYVVEGGEWSNIRIASICRKLRSYPLTMAADGYMKNLIVYIPRFWLFGAYDDAGSFKDQAGDAPFVFESVSISHSDTLVASRNGSQVDASKMWPLRTDIQIGLITVAPLFSDKFDKKAKGLEPTESTPYLPVEWH